MKNLSQRLNQSLSTIIRAYTSYDSSTESYYSKRLPLEERQKIEVQLITIFSQILTESGVQEEHINQQRRILLSFFHTDKLNSASPEIRWLENSLSDGANDGACFKLIDNCADELKQSKPNKDHSAFDQNNFNIDELINSLRQRKKEAKTLTQQTLIESTIVLLQNFKRFQGTMDEIEPCWFKITLQTLPFITSGFCIGLFIEELSFLYAVLFMMTKGGDWLKQFDNKSLIYLGEKTQEFSRAISSAATTLMVHFVSINFSALNTAYYIGIETCSKIYELIDYTVLPRTPTQASKSKFLTLVLAPQHFLPGKLIFQTLELKLLALKLEQYQDAQKLQYFAVWRKGNSKSRLIQQALQQFKLIDLKPISTEEKLNQANIIINYLANHPYFKEKNSQAKKTIESVKAMIGALTHDDEQLCLEKFK